MTARDSAPVTGIQWHAPGRTNGRRAAGWRTPSGPRRRQPESLSARDGLGAAAEPRSGDRALPRDGTRPTPRRRIAGAVPRRRATAEPAGRSHPAVCSGTTRGVERRPVPTAPEQGTPGHRAHPREPGRSPVAGDPTAASQARRAGPPASRVGRRSWPGPRLARAAQPGAQFRHDRPARPAGPAIPGPAEVVGTDPAGHARGRASEGHVDPQQPASRGFDREEVLPPRRELPRPDPGR